MPTGTQREVRLEMAYWTLAKYAQWGCGTGLVQLTDLLHPSGPRDEVGYWKAPFNCTSIKVPPAFGRWLFVPSLCATLNTWGLA